MIAAQTNVWGRRDAPAPSSPWQPRLFSRLRGQAHPLLVTEDAITPAASLWAGVRLWTAAFREAGLRPGDRVVLALPPSPGFVCALLAGLWESLTLALVPPNRDLESAAASLDASAVIAVDGVATWQADVCGLPCPTGRPIRPVRIPPTPEARLLLSTTGTTAAPRWIALSDANVLSVIDSHLPHLGLDGARVLSVLPWHHAFGLVIELLPALLAGAEIIRDGAGGRQPDTLARLIETHAITHLNAVPLTVERLLQAPGGGNAVRGLRGGVLGGAAVGASLAQSLSETRLRVGYGQTEASPGITLGDPGVWRAGYLGYPLGCRVNIGNDGQLAFAGPNACLGRWGASGLERLDSDRWVETGDIVRQEADGFYFLARADDMFKLSNGRPVPAGMLERALCDRAPQVRHALLYSRDGERLELLVGCGGVLPPVSVAREALGALGDRLVGIHQLPPHQWAQTPKGDIDRRAMTEYLSRMHPDRWTTTSCL